MHDSFIEREIKDIEIQGNHVTGKDNFVKLDFSNRYPITLSPARESFAYNEETRTLTYKIGAFYSILFNVIYSNVLFSSFIFWYSIGL